MGGGGVLEQEGWMKIRLLYEQHIIEALETYMKSKYLFCTLKWENIILNGTKMRKINKQVVGEGVEVSRLPKILFYSKALSILFK